MFKKEAPMRINPRTIAYVKAVAEQRSFSRAAEKLYISQPSLSQHILNAERSYGVRFFNRRTNPITLTYAGERFLSIANEMEQLDRQLSREMADIGGDTTGRITVGVSPTRGALFIPQLFARFKREYPKVELALSEDHNDKLLEAVRNGTVDFAFTGYGKPDLADVLIAERRMLLATRLDGGNPDGAKGGNCGNPGAAAEPIATGARSREPADDGSSDSAMAGSCDHAGSSVERAGGGGEPREGAAGQAESRGPVVHLADFADEPFVLLRKGRGIRRIADRLFEQAGIRPAIAYETGSYHMALGMAAQGLGSTFVIEQAPRRLPDGLRTYGIAEARETYRVHLVYRKDAYLSRPFQRFIELAEHADVG